VFIGVGRYGRPFTYHFVAFSIVTGQTCVETQSTGGTRSAGVRQGNMLHLRPYILL